MIQSGDVQFNKLVQESAQDSEMDKLLDNMIDQKMGQGKTDE